MNKTENMAVMLLTLTQSDEWFRLCDSDQGIREANDNLQAIIDKLAADNPDELTEQLWESVCCACDACSAVAMLYGNIIFPRLPDAGELRHLIPLRQNHDRPAGGIRPART